MKYNLILFLLFFSFCKYSNQNQTRNLLLNLFFLNSGYSDYEEGEEYSGGETTSFDITTVNAFDHPASNISTTERLIKFDSGNAFFNSAWTNPGSSARDGLGPFFNRNSCQGCHIRDGAGNPPDVHQKMTSMLIRISKSTGKDPVTNAPLPVEEYGLQLSNNDIHNNQKPEADPRIIGYNEFEVYYPDGDSVRLRKPIYNLNFNYAEPSDYVISPRVAPKVIGLGLLSAISKDDILSRADPEDSNGDGVSGKPNYVWDYKTNAPELGRFGWKANQPDLDQQNRSAFIGDMGLTSSMFTQEDCTVTSHPGIDCNHPPSGNSHPEVNDNIVDLVNFYTHLVAVPIRRNFRDPQVLRGKKIFFEIGCESCHRQKYITGDFLEFPEISRQKIYPYTDLLLHDMGDELADNRDDFLANGKEWRTPPLWGLGLTHRVNPSAGFLHDGRARTLEEAILWHGGEAESIKQRYINLPGEERKALIEFLKSL